MREESRGAITDNPIVVESPNEADAAFCKRSARLKRQIFAALEKIAVLSREVAAAAVSETI